MKSTLAILILCALISPVSAKESEKKIYSRGWIGGDYKLARPAKWFKSSKEIHAFPKCLRDQQHAAIFVSGVYSNTPLALSGVLPGDLILKAGTTITDSFKIFHRTIDECEPGSTLILSIYRGADTIEKAITIGEETYQKAGTLALGIILSSKIDLVPNSTFSAFALGFDRLHDRVDLSSSENAFVKRTRAANKPAREKERGTHSKEGWRVWCVLFSIGHHKTILTQKANEKIPVGAVARRNDAGALDAFFRSIDIRSILN